MPFCEGAYVQECIEFISFRNLVGRNLTFGDF